MKRLIVLLTISILIGASSSCSQQEQKKEPSSTSLYQKDKLSFALPDGWKVKQDYTNQQGRFLELDKYANYKVENTMAIGILAKKTPTDSIIADQIKQLSYSYRLITFKVLEKNKHSQLGKYNASLTTYFADDTQTKVYGKIYIIQENNQSIFVQIVENTQNSDDSEYTNIFNTFTLK